MVQSKTIYLISSLVFFAIAIALVGFLQVILVTFTDYGLIKEFPDSQQKFYDERAYQVTDRKLTNTIRDKIIIPDDELWYSFEVHNLKNFNTNINYELEFFKGGVREGESYTGSAQLLPFASDPQNINKIYLKTSGPYDVKLNVLFYNSTNEKYAQYTTGLEHIEVTSRSDQLQISQNDYLFWGVIAAFVTGIGTIIALGFSVRYSKLEVEKLDGQNDNLETQMSLLEDQNKLSKEQIDLLKTQNDDLKEQQSVQNRPWISLTDEIPKHKFGKNFVKILFRNYGKTPAINLEMRGAVGTTNKISLEFLSKAPYAQNLSIAPNETFGCKISLTDEEIEAGNEGNGLYFAVQLSYTYENDKKGLTTLTGSINNAILQGIEYDIKSLE